MDRAEHVRPFTLAYALLSAMHRFHGEQLTWRDFFDTLAGGDELRGAIQSGIDTEAYLYSISEAREAFVKRRPSIYQS